MTPSVPGYRVEHLIGCGGQAEVWAALAVASGDRVALKWIATDSPAAARAARAEAALLAALDHPSLIKLRECLILDGAVVLITELAEAGSLAQLLDRRGKLSSAEVIAAISPVAAALAHAHQEGVLHGDVSAGNILFTAAGAPKLADLGVARLLVSSEDCLGTPAYLDPVIASGGIPGAASDVFSLAAVALHALTGAGPWQRLGEPAADAERTTALAATGEIAELDARLAGLDDQLVLPLKRALDPDPFRRGSAADLALDLRASLPPAPIVFAGGRILHKVGRHSIELRARDSAVRRSAGEGDHRPASAGASSAAPTGSMVVPADLTHVARPAVRAALAGIDAGVGAEAGRRSHRPSLRGLRLPSVPRRLPAPALRLPGWAAAGIAAAVAGALVCSAVLACWPRHRSAAAAPAALASAGPRAVGRDPLAALTGLDQIRAQAYAQRDPAILQRVYRSPTLLAQDVAQLQSWVPADCRLTGLRTSYRDPQILYQGQDGVQVRVTASLAPATLSCAEKIRSKTQPVGPLILMVRLVADRGSLKIASQSYAGPSS